MSEAVPVVFHSPVSSHRTALVIGEDRADMLVTLIACATEARSLIVAQGFVNDIPPQNTPPEDDIGETFSQQEAAPPKRQKNALPLRCP